MGKYIHFRVQHSQKYRLYQKKLQIKVGGELNFLQNTHLVHMSVFSKSGARGLQRLPCLKYYIRKQESRFTLELNTARNIRYIKKKLQIKVGGELNFPQKTK